MPIIVVSRQPANRALLVLVLLLFGGLFLWQCGVRPRQLIPRAEVQSLVEIEARRMGLEPRFVLAIIEAESGFNAHATSRNARGMMQLTRPAWRSITTLPYDHAWDWRVNVCVGIAYLAYCRDLLLREGRCTYPHLAACYHYGFGTLRNVGFDLSRLPAPGNSVYRQLWQGCYPP